MISIEAVLEIGKINGSTDRFLILANNFVDARRIVVDGRKRTRSV